MILKFSGAKFMNKELEWIEYYKNLLSKHNITYRKNGFEIIENALKDYQELLESQCVLVVRTHGTTQKIIDKICKHYKEVKITNLEDGKKLKALEIIKKYKVNVYEFMNECIESELPYLEYVETETWDYIQNGDIGKPMECEEYELLKEVCLERKL